MFVPGDPAPSPPKPKVIGYDNTTVTVAGPRGGYQKTEATPVYAGTHPVTTYTQVTGPRGAEEKSSTVSVPNTAETPVQSSPKSSDPSPKNNASASAVERGLAAQEHQTSVAQKDGVQPNPLSANPFSPTPRSDVGPLQSAENLLKEAQSRASTSAQSPEPGHHDGSRSSGSTGPGDTRSGQSSYAPTMGSSTTPAIDSSKSDNNASSVPVHITPQALAALDHTAAHDAGAAYVLDTQEAKKLNAEAKKAKTAGSFFGPNSAESLAQEATVEESKAAAAKATQTADNEKAAALGGKSTEATAALDHIAAHAAGAAYVGEENKINKLETELTASEKAGNDFGSGNSAAHLTGEIAKDKSLASADKTAQGADNKKAAAFSATDGLNSSANTQESLTVGSGATDAITVSDNPHNDSTGPHALVRTVTANNGLDVNTAYTDAGETWAEFSADNREFKQGGHIDAGRTFEIRTDKVTNLENKLGGGTSSGTVAGLSGPNVGVTAPPSTARTPAQESGGAGLPPSPATSGGTADGIVSTGSGAVVPLSGVNDPTAAITITNDSHPDSSDTSVVVDVQKVTVDNPGGMSVTQAYQAAGETQAQFIADNTEFKPGGQIDRGHTFEIRNGGTEGQGNIQTLENNVGGNVTIVEPTPALTGSAGTPTVVSGTPTPITGAPAGPATIVAAPAPPTPPPDIAQGSGDQAGLGMAPNTTIASYTNAHPDSSGALVVTMTASTRIPVSKAYSQYGENWAEFSADNQQFKSDGTVAPGHTYNIRADKAQPSVGGGGANASGAFQSFKSTSAALMRGAFLRKSHYKVAEAPAVDQSAHHEQMSGGQAMPPAHDPVTSAVVDKPYEKPKVSATKPQG